MHTNTYTHTVHVRMTHTEAAAHLWENVDKDIGRQRHRGH